MPNFDAVKFAERDEIRDARGHRLRLFPLQREQMPAPDDVEKAGIAFSGGGIRSATFNLGILQGLARYNLLQRFDYISTVSGGGFIGSWLISWIKRRGLQEVVKGLASSPASLPLNPVPPPALMKPAEPPGPDETYREAEPINFLREYSNYLTPRMGIFGADTWAAAATYVRNLLLNLTILVSFLSAVLLLPRVWEALFLGIACWAGKRAQVHIVSGNLTAPLNPMVWPLALCAAALLLSAIFAASWNLASHTFPALLKSKFTKQGWVVGLVVAPLFVAAPLAAVGLWLGSENLKNLSWGCWALGGSIVYGLLRLAGLILNGLWIRLRGLHSEDSWQQELVDGFWLVVFAFVAGPLGGLIVGWSTQKFREWAPLTGDSAASHVSGVARVACWGTPFLVGALLLTGVLHIGLMSLKFNNQKREWWARMTGWLLIFSVSGAALFGLGIYAPLGVSLLSGYSKTALGGGWILSTLGGLLAGKSGSTSGKYDANSMLELAAKIAPYVFVVGLLFALSFGIHRVITPRDSSLSTRGPSVVHAAQVSGNLHLVARDAEGQPGGSLTELKMTYSAQPLDESEKIKEEFWGEVQRSADRKLPLGCFSLAGWGWLLCLSLLLAAAALFLSMRVDINEFSMQLLYRNRLVRCYLGASNGKRNPQPFSGFDPKDDEKLTGFSVHAAPSEGIQTYAGPYPILNSTLSVTHGERLAWQERKGESFVFTPRYCGYEFHEQYDVAGGRMADRSDDGKKSDGYQETKTYAYEDGGVYLGTAAATSGAAANPNMGFHTSPPLAFLMTVFNVRLGWWLGNPQDPDTRHKATPLFGLAYLLKELFALTDDRSGFVNLSDGFHFENLGLYELVRRRCKFIVVGDAGADPQHSFDDLGNAIRKCRTDFGI